MTQVGFWSFKGLEQFIPDDPIARDMAEDIKRACVGFPEVQDHVDPVWWGNLLLNDQRRLLRYIETVGKVQAPSRGPSVCRLCGCSNGSGEHCDGTYQWPDGFLHYVRDHAVRPPDDFIAHALRQVS